MFLLFKVKEAILPWYITLTSEPMVKWRWYVGRRLRECTVLPTERSLSQASMDNQTDTWDDICF